MLTVAAADHEEIRKAADSLHTRLVVSRTAAVAVLTGFNQGTFTPAEAQSWASFVRRGYVARGLGPIRPLDIGYEEAWEEAIVEAVTQLDQIGDLMDGYVTKG